MADAEKFSNDKGLSEYSPLFARAALVARNPNHFDQVEELLPEEREALAYERDHKTKNSFWLWYSVTVCAVGAA